MEHPQHQVYHQTPSFTNYMTAKPSSTHSSPRSFTPDLDLYQNSYPSPSPYPPSHSLPTRPAPHKSASFGALQVSTANTTREEDPNERTARPSNAHVHTQFHTQTLPLPSQPVDQNSDAQDAVGKIDYTVTTPGLSGGLTRPLRPLEQERLAHLDRLKFFLATAPSRWDSAGTAPAPNTSTPSTSTSLPMTNAYPQPNRGSAINGMESLTMSMHPSVPTQGHSLHHPSLNRFLLPSQEYVTCVLWNGLYHITGTDIVRALVFRFEVRSLVDIEYDVH
jgi:transcription factor STE12